MNRKQQKIREAKGLTLIELIITVSILGIMAFVAMPGILGGIQRAGVNGASRQLTEDIRLTMSNALTRGVQARLVLFDQTGQALNPNPGGTTLNDVTKANKYRIEVRTSPSASWPAVSDTLGGNTNVLTEWKDIAQDYRGVRVTTGNTVQFNSNGFLTVTANQDVAVQGSGGTKTVRTSPIGKATII
jgi:prepilin-type N-terminal cleavage/methylation domain-containing protein